MKLILGKLKKIIIRFLSESWFMYDPKDEIANEKWRIHKIDADQNFPSVPHAECRTNPRLKMNIYTGEIYNKSNKHFIKKASRKELENLWNDNEFRKIVYDERIRYWKNYNKEPDEIIPEKYIKEYIEEKKKI